MSEEALRRRLKRRRYWDFWKFHAPLLAFGMASLRLLPWILFKMVLVPCIEMIGATSPDDIKFVGAYSMFVGLPASCFVLFFVGVKIYEDWPSDA